MDKFILHVDFPLDGVTSKTVFFELSELELHTDHY